MEILQQLYLHLILFHAYLSCGAGPPVLTELSLRGFAWNLLSCIPPSNFLLEQILIQM